MIPLDLLMKENFRIRLSARVFKQKIRNHAFGSTLKVCILLIFLTIDSSLACGYGYYYDLDHELITSLNVTEHIDGPVIDEPLFINLTGIDDPLDRNIMSAWRGWEPNNETKEEWEKWYEDWLIKNGKSKKGTGKPGGSGGTDQDDAAEPPGNVSDTDDGWPKLPGWEELGPGNDGDDPPPWAYVPKNVGKPTICYLPPVKGKCDEFVERWGFNPYTDRCEEYMWSGCGGTRNRFSTKESCEEHCKANPPPTCSSDSGILQKNQKQTGRF